jgi:hypothetical protein
MHLLQYPPSPFLLLGLSLIKVWWEHFASLERMKSVAMKKRLCCIGIVCLIHRPSIFTFSHPDVYERCQEFNLLILLWLYLHEKRFPLLSAIICAECRVQCFPRRVQSAETRLAPARFGFEFESIHT